MGITNVPWSKAGYDGRIIMMRKRNNSGSEMGSGMYLITQTMFKEPLYLV